jgi:uncharacterized protein (TIGR03437 family)
MNFKIADHRAGMRRSLFIAILLTLTLVDMTTGDRFRLFPGRVAAQQAVVLINAASYAADPNAGMAPDSIGALYGSFVTQGNQAYPAPPGVTPLPTTLGGVAVTIGGKAASLFYVGTTQINLLVPADIPDGTATISVTNADGTTRAGSVRIARTEPGIFTALSSGSGVAAALTTKDGQSYSYVSNADGSARDVDAGTREQPNYLVLFGTGLRLAAAGSLTVTIQGVPAKVLYAGAAPGFAGLDQINLTIPPELAGLGTVQIRVRTPLRNANPVNLQLGGTLPLVRLNPISEGGVVNGELNAEDQVQVGTGTNTYFFDAFVFNTTAPNTSLAIDLRAPRFNSLLLLYRVDNGGLVQIAQDDESGDYGGSSSAPNHNPLLLTVIPSAGQYVIFVTSSDLQPNATGTYTLKYTTNVIQQISYGQTVNGEITASDYKNAAETFVDLYWFNGLLGETPSIGLNSTAFDPFLILHGNQGDPSLAFNDNLSSVNTNSLINNYRLTTSGVHILIATPFEPNKTGAYTLNLNRASTLMNGLDGHEVMQTVEPGWSGREGSLRFRHYSGGDATRFRPAMDRQLHFVP